MHKFFTLVGSPSLSFRVSQLSALTTTACSVRCLSASSSVQVELGNDSKPKPNPKPYSAIPGPLKLPYIGTVWNFVLPWNWGKPLLSLQMERAKKYGKIYREHVPFFGDVVFLLDPNDAQKFFRAQGKYPKRVPFDMWKEAREEMQIDVGLLLS